MSRSTYYSHGKLLLTGEYAVLDGAKALAFPCKLGQHLTIESSTDAFFEWVSYLDNAQVWKSTTFNLDAIKNQIAKDEFKQRLLGILHQIYIKKPELFNAPLKFSTRLEFNKDWGLGSSSTLISNLASWARVDPYSLLESTFGGSGYDIAAAKADTPFIFQRKEHSYQTRSTVFPEVLKPFMYFVYLNQKQNSRAGIKRYKAVNANKAEAIDQISMLTEEVLKVNDLHAFEGLMVNHEKIISELTDQIPVQTLKFPDYTHGIVKSLGAWGGDFVLVTAKEKSHLDYFKLKGYTQIFNYTTLIADKSS